MAIEICHARVAGPLAPQQKLEHSGVQLQQWIMSQTTALFSPGFVMELTWVWIQI